MRAWAQPGQVSKAAMNNVPIDGLRLLLVESCALIATFGVAFALIRFNRLPDDLPTWIRWTLARNSRAVFCIVVAALVGRALLLPFIPIPEPRINDEYSYLLMADTFAHHRLTNPTPPAWQHFETFHVNLTPTYHSKYPVSQGAVLAFGQIVFHQPWIGVYLSTALLCGAICWCLQVFVPPGWALLGGLLAMVRLAFFSYWMNSYWGGSFAAFGGAIALGAVVRLSLPGLTNRRRSLYSCAFATALLILATSRPYEGLAYSIPLLACLTYQVVQSWSGRKAESLAMLLPVAAISLFGMVLMGHYNQRTTGNLLLLPHILNERTYSPLPLFLGQKPKPDLVFRDPVFEKFFRLTKEEYGYHDTTSIARLAGVEAQRLGIDWLFFVSPALSFPVLLGLLLSIKHKRLRIVFAVTLFTIIALGLCVYSMPHYAAPATIVVYIFAVKGLRYLWRQKANGERAFVIAVCLTVVAVSFSRQTASCIMNSAFTLPDARTLVAQQLEGQPGRHLVLVSYDLVQHYPGNELVHNGAEFNDEKVLWARSKGPQSDSELCRLYSDRTFWSVTTDDQSVSLRHLNACN